MNSSCCRIISLLGSVSVLYKLLLVFRVHIQLTNCLNWINYSNNAYHVILCVMDFDFKFRSRSQGPLSPSHHHLGSVVVCHISQKCWESCTLTHVHTVFSQKLNHWIKKIFPSCDLNKLILYIAVNWIVLVPHQLRDDQLKSVNGQFWSSTPHHLNCIIGPAQTRESKAHKLSM